MTHQNSYSRDSSKKYTLWAAKFISLIFTPFYLPVMAFVLLFIFSYLKMLPWSTKGWLLLMVWAFTVVFPHLLITVYRKVNGWTHHQMGKRERRVVPYLLSITCYALLLYIMYSIHLPRFTLSIIATALTIQVICALVNGFIKVSTHAAGAGGVVGSLMGFSIIFNFDPTYWLCLTIMVCGMVCTSRLLLRQHNQSELYLGVFIGMLCGFTCVLAI